MLINDLGWLVSISPVYKTQPNQYISLKVTMYICPLSFLSPLHNTADILDDSITYDNPD